MFSFLSKKKPTTAAINGLAITVQPKETLLQAALRQGIDFPHSCRVGGCAACKCKLVNGKVKELTEASYILSDADLDQGYILACQSVPTTDVTIEVDISAQQARRQVQGRVIGQERLTHDITQLRVQLDEALTYKAGQYANLSLATLPGVARSYSFATPMQPEAQVSFFVRKVPGGTFSSQINEQDVVGHAITVDGPLGDFWLRPTDAPLFLVAGGSGLAPILALLQDALASQSRRPVTLLFGARQARDLYALDQIQALERQWPAAFHFMPVLSADDIEPGWTGARGMVIEHIPTHLPVGAQAYLCGPPVMIDAAVPLLKKLGVAPDHIFTDRFTTLHDPLSAAA